MLYTSHIIIIIYFTITGRSSYQNKQQNPTWKSWHHYCHRNGGDCHSERQDNNCLHQACGCPLTTSKKILYRILQLYFQMFQVRCLIGFIFIYPSNYCMTVRYSNCMGFERETHNHDGWRRKIHVGEVRNMMEWKPVKSKEEDCNNKTGAKYFKSRPVE